MVALTQKIQDGALEVAERSLGIRPAPRIDTSTPEGLLKWADRVLNPDVVSDSLSVAQNFLRALLQQLSINNGEHYTDERILAGYIVVCGKRVEQGKAPEAMQAVIKAVQYIAKSLGKEGVVETWHDLVSWDYGHFMGAKRSTQR